MTMDANDALETARVFPDATLFAAHTDGRMPFKQSAERLAAAFASLGVGHRPAAPEPGRPVAFAL
ncbi:hypothetical protein [Xanthobacter aminoxidans]|uniref:hypothetical protein n=1 Tax=Xanthobacter aminoxidans TaxID=186280 RepID=UPI003729F120